ncbi:hypothetical protein B0I26_102220 [Anoxybacillus vitaminiphilus]|jgi:hypothetical protein|uniref:Uncharacterized protein n=1 Tax=Paranoxybacillus vitaminiphilus TaxID=581036 RepID=A0A327YMU0_9BACL|nr:hypothetical protein [Anoxybacillus vitaminiphilus]RAK22230.1 hypothetical protein B0I26_102220 [Anoxybacillus vitaminiphilus]
MLIRRCKGYELEKAQPNTSEDFFNRSEVTFVEDGNEKTLHVLYVRYFDELFPSFTPYEQDPIFTVGQREVCFKDIVALVCLLKNPGFRHRKRVYINSEKEFQCYFEHVEFDKLPEIFSAIEMNNGYELKSPLLFIKQPS